MNPIGFCFLQAAGTMDTLISLLVLSTLPQLVVPTVPTLTSLRAVAELVSKESRIFSGESARLSCSILDDSNTVWNYRWFRGSEQLQQSGRELGLWHAQVKESGKFYCQGWRSTKVRNLYTLRSPPVELEVDGGWAILSAPPHPGFVGDTLKLTCRIRGDPPLHSMILYKDGVEVMRQNGSKPYFHLTNLTLEDQGMYSCQASWDMRRRTISVISVATHVMILEILSQPRLEIVARNDLITLNMMKVICNVQYNALPPAPPINYYFYKNNIQLGPATSENHDLVILSSGEFSCRAKVPQLEISRWSEPTSFGQTTAQPTATQLFIATLYLDKL